jgi:hypothetical protein
MNYQHIKLAAIDVGYGHTKYVNVADNKLDVAVFPSICVNVVATEEELGFSSRSNIRKVIISPDKPAVWVGPDITSKLSGLSHSRELSDRFCLSDDYLAFVRGALTYINLNPAVTLPL